MKVEKGLQEEGSSWPGARRLVRRKTLLARCARRKEPPGQVLGGRPSWPGARRKDPPGQELGGKTLLARCARRKTLLARC